MKPVDKLLNTILEIFGIGFVVAVLLAIFLIPGIEHNATVLQVHIKEYNECEPNTLELSQTALKMDKNTLRKIYMVASQTYNIEYELLMAISIHETANFKSKAYLNLNNVGGNMEWSTGKSKLMVFDNVYDGVMYYARNLRKNYFDKGLTTIEQIQKRYCPVGAKNDPNGLNINWTRKVNQFYNELKGGK